ncbi:hypothetical protein CAC42_6286 [Sphaceloma murrayae]|uniref:Nucleotide-diphospho-sugar transferase domain-containing protein n=1 Tax=Sphaceloma murrayae TaxID=2082308 RepID=A0A2K1QTW4_9PEZI|nr:hypothetical protein CAC42_6286 [Sphaceloma murrayae]
MGYAAQTTRYQLIDDEKADSCHEELLKDPTFGLSQAWYDQYPSIRVSRCLHISAAVVLVLLGFMAGRIYPKSSQAANPPTILSALRALGPPDLEKEYGLKSSDLTLYPEPLGRQICLVNVDNRTWSPQYLYANLHGYDYRYIQVPEPQGLHGTWVKVKGQFRLTMEGKCKFVIVLDADVMFHDLRLPLGPILSYWNITDDIALAGAHGGLKDVKGNFLINTGLIITQKTPQLPQLMRDWIDCPTDVKYRNCSHWRYEWAHEQSALSEHVRYDYQPYIREMAMFDVHGPHGKFTKHYWGPEKVNRPGAVHDSIWKGFIPQISDKFVADWKDVSVHVESDSEYDRLMVD